MSSSYHPQMDGQTEVINRTSETYLRCFTSTQPHSWIKWLSLAEWWYKTTFHSTSKTTPFQALYGYPPPTLISYIPGTTQV
uniref:Uncharacterized protein n=1 Tax=Nelumbo nucifera TaxID=4432 RepID=A0A822XV25_NELNU|nr:TPA_asm: hypothetical protein HUJ06_022761 [Nelumbo nucifera]